jgi:hypothetical protein
MSLISDQTVEQALAYLQDWNAAKARAAAEYLDDMTKVVLAQLMDECEEKSAAAKEMWARAQPAFQEHLEQVRDARERDYKHRQRLSSSSAILDVWRTQQASNRLMDKVR